MSRAFFAAGVMVKLRSKLGGKIGWQASRRAGGEPGIQTPFVFDTLKQTLQGGAVTSYQWA